MKFKYISKKIDYDGTQLKSLCAYLNHGLLGDSMIAFEGACDISFEHMVDGEDFLAGSKICGSHMLHFIVEEFGMSMELAVTRQRLLAALAFELIVQNQVNKSKTSNDDSHNLLRREGDDIYVADGKLSISIATVSPVSALIHFAVNVSNEGTPVKTASLSDLGIKPSDFARDLGQAYLQEVTTIKEACCKVHWVK